MLSFDSALAAVLREEGGFVNDPLDPGGVTCLGVTKAVWDQWCGRESTIADMRALTPLKVAPLYRAQYWNALQCDRLPGPLALCVFDFGVNAGIGRAARYLQGMVGATEDGHIGDKTIAAAGKWIGAHGIREAVTTYQNGRRAYYRSLAQFPRYGKGWLRRVNEIEEEALGAVP